MMRELTTESEWLEGFPVMKELRTHLCRRTYLEFLRTMTADGYRLFALYDGREIAALAGISIVTNFYFGKHVFVYDLVTKASGRSKGFGKKLLAQIHQYAKDNGCGAVALGSEMSNVDAHRFYEAKMGYEKAAYSFMLVL
ncbi:GNAT family N-acetyltransferase [Paenibacillus sp. GCM10023250]|uniref:GNAT family N-acetyltransferase n=1 Tax=Paenibacillus sp. GCM10023250 TaxID=3252648 RepID=UPI00361FB70A